MKKHYIIIILFAFSLLVSSQSFAQSSPQNNAIDIEELNIFPNPVNQGRLYISISTKLNEIKEVEIFNVLGKQIFETTLLDKKLNISKLNKGVYILKVTENNISTTRKLVIK